MWRTVIEMMVHQAEAHPEAVFARFLNPAAPPSVYTYAATWRWICRWADLLAERGVKRGAAVMLALPTSDDFVGAYFGTLLIGGIPAALPPARNVSPYDPYLALMARRIQFIGATTVVLPESQADAALLPPLSDIAGLGVLTRRDLPTDAVGRSPQASPSDLALCQFTSGTSGDFKVVQLSHSALVAQARMISEALKVDPRTDSAVSWLPLSHDMGLIGFLLTPASIAGCVTHLRTEDFVKRPGLWIKALSDFGATITAAPPSGYALTASRMKDSEVALYRLDHVRVALVGAETVTEACVRQFAAKFAPIGFTKTSLMPTYGLAENGLAVSMSPLDRDPEFDRVDLGTLQHEGRAVAPYSPERSSRAFACVGRPLKATDVTIVDETGQELPERRVGEIIVRSPSLMCGYYRRPEATQQALRDGWLYTGDMGYLADGKLYVTGRKKELLIVGGRNYYPQDLEEVAGVVQGVRMRRTVAVSHFDSDRATELVVLLAETTLTQPTDREILRQNIRRTLIDAGYPVSKVILLRPKSIQSTANGKLMRLDCLNRYRAGEFSHDNETR